LPFKNVLDAAILLINTGPEHSRVGINLYFKNVVKIASIPGHNIASVEGFGATLLQVPGVGIMEGDWPGTRVGGGVSGLR